MVLYEQKISGYMSLKILKIPVVGKTVSNTAKGIQIISITNQAVIP